MLSFRIIVAILLYSTICRGLNVRVDIPSYKEIGSGADLRCLYDLGSSSLYSVKWYKGERQFYHYIPAKQNPKRSFISQDLVVDLDSSNEGTVRLVNLSMSASGKYRCEVITEAPHFNTKFGYGKMTIIDLPESAPLFSGLRQSYRLGEKLDLNCTSPSSVPAASLYWLVNDLPVNHSHWVVRYPVQVDSMGRETSTSGLQLRLARAHFQGGAMRVKCRAKIGDLFFQSQEKVILKDDLYQYNRYNDKHYFPLFYYNESSGIYIHALFVKMLAVNLLLFWLLT